MVVFVRFWDYISGKVMTKYFNSQFLSRPSAKLLHELLGHLIQELSKNIFHSCLWMDQIWILKSSDESREQDDLPSFINVGSCSLVPSWYFPDWHQESWLSVRQNYEGHVAVATWFTNKKRRLFKSFRKWGVSIKVKVLMRFGLLELRNRVMQNDVTLRVTDSIL